MEYAEILIVDDMPDHIAYSGSILQQEGCRVFAATSGKAVRRFLEHRLPDLILLDIQMSDISGLEICKRINASPRLRDIPIIFLTSETSQEVISLGFSVGGSDYIKKPFIKEEFLARISTQLRLANQKKELIAANNELNQFCTAVTHDLKAPFNVVNMLIEMLRQELGDVQSDSVATVMSMITDKSTQARIMIERLFEFSRICNVQPRLMSVDIRAIAQETFEELHALCPERQIEFTCARLPRVTGDETLIRMIVKNLLQNAIKYTGKREMAQITITAGHDRAHHVIKFQDNGAGFDMAYVGKIFRVFERLHSEDQFPGSGVGLATVHRIMERHNGHIEAYGEVDNGATFTLYFPKQMKPNRRR